MKTLFFVPYDDPFLVKFWCAGIPLAYPLVFLRHDLVSEDIFGKRIHFVFDPRDSIGLDEYVIKILADAKTACIEEDADTIVCFLPYEDFVEVVDSQVDILLPDWMFFGNQFLHVVYNPGDTGAFFVLEDVEGGIVLQQLPKEQTRLLICAN